MVFKMLPSKKHSGSISRDLDQPSICKPDPKLSFLHFEVRFRIYDADFPVRSTGFKVHDRHLKWPILISNQNLNFCQFAIPWLGIHFTPYIKLDGKRIFSPGPGFLKCTWSRSELVLDFSRVCSWSGPVLNVSKFQSVLIRGSLVSIFSDIFNRLACG